MRSAARCLTSTAILIIGGWSCVCASVASAQPAEPTLVRDTIADVTELIQKRSVGIANGISLSYVEPDRDGSQGGLQLAVEREWKHSIVKAIDPRFGDDGERLENPARAGAYGTISRTISLSVDGSYAFEGAANPEELTTTLLKLSLERAFLGELELLDAPGEAQFCLAQPGTDVTPDMTPEEIARARAIEQDCRARHGVARMSDDTAYLVGLDVHAGFEADQRFDDFHALYGLDLRLVTYPSAALAKLNVLDYPFRLLRGDFLTNDPPFVAPLPSLRVTIDQVDASENEMRSMLTDDDSFSRISGELGFRTLVARIGSTGVRFSGSYRYFHEFDAPDAIEDAGLDSFDYYSLRLIFPFGVPAAGGNEDEAGNAIFVRYVDGQLPFDLQEDEAVQVGFSSNWAALTKLLTGE